VETDLLRKSLRDSRRTWKTLRVSHSSHRPHDDDQVLIHHSGGRYFGAKPAVLADRVYFIATDETSLTAAMWRTDGTTAGTEQIFVTGAVSASGGRPLELTSFGDGILFSARAAASGREPWISDGTAAGTEPLGDLASGSEGSDPRHFTALGDSALFSAWSPSTGRELFVTDGSAPGTELLLDILPGAASSDPGDLVRLGSAVLFRACDASTGCELWRSDGTALGTARLKDIVPGIEGSFPEKLVASGGRVFFRASTPDSGTELWLTDGTSPGTLLVAEIAAGPASSLPQDLEADADRVFFIADDGTHGLEVWSSDGTPGGTSMPVDLATGSSSTVSYASDDYHALHAGNFYFSTYMVTGFDQLWKTDGTALGTVLVKDSMEYDPFGGAGFQWMSSGGTFLWFGVYEPDGNWEPYRTDGTPGGTIKVDELNPGASGSQPYGFSPFQGNTYFQARTLDGFRLFRGSGYPNETVALGPPGAASVSVLQVAQKAEAGSKLFFSGSTSSDGAELFAYWLPIQVTGFESGGFVGWEAVVGGP